MQQKWGLFAQWEGENVPKVEKEEKARSVEEGEILAR